MHFFCKAILTNRQYFQKQKVFEGKIARGFFFKKNIQNCKAISIENDVQLFEKTTAYGSVWFAKIAIIRLKRGYLWKNIRKT